MYLILILFLFTATRWSSRFPEVACTSTWGGQNPYSNSAHYSSNQTCTPHTRFSCPHSCCDPLIHEELTFPFILNFHWIRPVETFFQLSEMTKSFYHLPRSRFYLILLVSIGLYIFALTGPSLFLDEPMEIRQEEVFYEIFTSWGWNQPSS